MQVEVQCEQLSREMVRQREQLDREANALQERLNEARKEGHAEACKQKEQLAHTVSVILVDIYTVCVEKTKQILMIMCVGSCPLLYFDLLIILIHT